MKLFAAAKVRRITAWLAPDAGRPRDNEQLIGQIVPVLPAPQATTRSRLSLVEIARTLPASTHGRIAAVAAGLFTEQTSEIRADRRRP